MSEERTQYTVHPGIAIRLEISEKYIRQLERTNDGLTMVMGRHRETMREQAERIAELEAALAGRDRRVAELLEDRQMLQAQVDADRTIVADQAIRIVHLEATVARLGADNRRLRHLDAMPVDAIVRLMDNCGYATDCDYSERAYHADWTAANDWFKSRDGDA